MLFLMNMKVLHLFCWERMTTFPSMSFCILSINLPYSVYKSSVLQLEILGNSGILLSSLPNKAVINLIFEC